MRRAIETVAIAICVAGGAVACSVLTLSELHDPPPTTTDAKTLDGGADAAYLADAASDSVTTNGGCVIGTGAAACQLIATPTDAGLTGIYYSTERRKVFVAAPSEGIYVVDPTNGESALIAPTSAKRVLGSQGTKDVNLFVATQDAGVVAINMTPSVDAGVTMLQAQLLPFEAGANVAAIAVDLNDKQETDEGDVYWLERERSAASDASPSSSVAAYSRHIVGARFGTPNTLRLSVETANLPMELAIQNPPSGPFGPLSRSAKWAVLVFRRSPSRARGLS